MADPDEVRAGGGERFDERLAGGRLAVGDEHLAELRVAGECAKLAIIRHVCLLRRGSIGKRDKHGLAGTIELDVRYHLARRLPDALMHVRHDRRAAVELHEPKPPRQALAKEKIVAMVQDRVREKLTALRLRLPVEADREAVLARLARRVLHHAAVAALLELETPERGGGGEAKRDAAARGRWQRRQPRAQDWVLPLGSL